ncbi:hypothetical protein CGLO_08605 [Colletotrichum gloeosporioides Cg-14]|uniref:Uncharacterized protein n=1 Tax=Colletotrichum gloeosporioides (strain Cg-14) TaxID=1237896 RepID=T0LJI7_COLGC|nr:hypothetical protein CGLO_08605 [Colletotrichum gloeosporioides Cg-14]
MSISKRNGKRLIGTHTGFAL